MKVLILGGGGREAAIAWKISQSELLTKLYCAPGNPGTEQLATNLDLNIREFASIKEAILTHQIEMVIVGPEEPLVKGLKEYLKEDVRLNSLVFIGPSSKGAQLEGSKYFAKQFMERHNIATAKYKTFTAEELKEATTFINSLSTPIVLKADGLAAGKGVIISESREEAIESFKEMTGGIFGEAGNRVVIEEYLEGIELSYFILTDGREFVTLPEAKDYKRRFEGDKGGNTGGMGAVSPVPFVDSQFKKRVEEQIVKRTIEGLKNDGIEYEGFLFIGLMNCNGEPYVIEYNVRLGDPEAEAILPRIKSDLLSHLIKLGKGELNSVNIESDPRFSLTLITVSEGYPNEYKEGYPITLPEKLNSCNLFHSGTKIVKNKIVTSGGRVLALNAMGDSIEECREKLYSSAAEIEYKGVGYRKDIGLDLL